jgi:hypothetical protein
MSVLTLSNELFCVVTRRRLDVITNGSLQATCGTFGWKLVDNSKLVLYSGSGPVDGPFDSANSTCCEIGGCAAPLLLITVIAKYWGIRHRCKLHWIVDSKAAISKVLVNIRPGATPCRQPNEFDLPAFIEMLQKELRRPIKIAWIKGHQDATAPYDKLSYHAQMNVDVDKLATNHRNQSLPQSSQTIDHRPSSRVSIILNGRRLTSNIDSSIRYHVNGYHVRLYLQKRHSWSDQVWNTVDMWLFGRHFTKLTPSQQVSHLKFVHDQQPLGKDACSNRSSKILSLNSAPVARSPETQFHFLQCDRNLSREHLLSSLRRSVCDSDIYPVKYVLTAGLQHWFHDLTTAFLASITEFPSHHHVGLLRAVEQQNLIGWHQAILGFLGQSWHAAASLEMVHPTASNAS